MQLKKMCGWNYDLLVDNKIFSNMIFFNIKKVRKNLCIYVKSIYLCNAFQK